MLFPYSQDYYIYILHCYHNPWICFNLCPTVKWISPNASLIVVFLIYLLADGSSSSSIFYKKGSSDVQNVYFLPLHLSDVLSFLNILWLQFLLRIYKHCSTIFCCGKFALWKSEISLYFSFENDLVFLHSSPKNFLSLKFSSIGL